MIRRSRSVRLPIKSGWPRATGRAAVLEMLRGSVNGLDRKMDSRTPQFEAPTMEIEF
jgi:hypothetical protein